MDIHDHSATNENSSELPEVKCCRCGKIPQSSFDGRHCPYCRGPIGIITKPDPETQCGNCHEELQPEDQYCRFCGTKRGEGAYEPYYEMLDTQELYGPRPLEIMLEYPAYLE